MADNKPAAKRIVDVAQPDKVAALPTSKAVIVTNHGILRDPMVASRPANDELDVPSALPLAPPSKPEPDTMSDGMQTAPSIRKGVMKPLTETEKVAAPAVKAAPPAAAETAEVKQPDYTPPAPVNDEAGLALPDQKKKEAEAKRQAELERLVEEKTYFLPIKTVEQRRTARFVLIGVILSLLLLVAWLNIALDAGLIELSGLKPLTHFFSN